MESLSPEDKYGSKQLIGQGAYGKVYKAKVKNMTFAIKNLKFTNTSSILKEVSLYNLMSHPNILSPFEYYPSNNNTEINIVMNFYDQTLEKIIENQSYNDDILCLIFWKILSAMDYIHFNGIIHRDLKPENILFDDVMPIVADFGIAKYHQEDYEPFDVIGIQTWPYRAPEVFHAQYYFKQYEDRKSENDLDIFNKMYKNTDSKIDMWSVGVMLYECLAGKSFYSNTISEKSLMKASKEGKFPIPSFSQFSPEISQVLTGLLQIDPNKRLSARQAMSLPWFRKFRYQEPEQILYPIPRPIPYGPTRLKKLESLIPGMTGCKFDKNVFDYMIKLLAEYMREDINRDKFTSNFDELKIMYRIAYSVVKEHNSYDECRFEKDHIYPKIYEVFEDLNFNIYYA